MSKDLNYCSFIGRLGNTPELKYTANQKAVTNFSIACGDDYTKDGQKHERTNWIRVVAYGKLAEICGQYLNKGSRVFISGKQTSRQWQDQSGNDRYTTEIIANEMQMLDSRSDASPHGNNAAPAPAQQQQQQPVNDDFDDDIPF